MHSGSAGTTTVDCKKRFGGQAVIRLIASSFFAKFKN
jgi:hypothetical protein